MKMTIDFVRVFQVLGMNYSSTFQSYSTTLHTVSFFKKKNISVTRILVPTSFIHFELCACSHFLSIGPLLPINKARRPIRLQDTMPSRPVALHTRA